MRYTRIDVVTSLSTQDLGNMFTTATRSMHGFNYYRPHDEIAVLDREPAAFEIGVHIPAFTGSTGGVVLHMFVWDRGEHREAQLVSAHGRISGAAKSRKRLQQLVQAIQKDDAHAEVAAV